MTVLEQLAVRAAWLVECTSTVARRVLESQDQIRDAGFRRLAYWDIFAGRRGEVAAVFAKMGRVVDFVVRSHIVLIM